MDYVPKYIAVRSSATLEDSKIDAWAGQLESYLYSTRESLLGDIQKCWASLYSPRALFYRVERKLNRRQVSVAVVVQEMIDSEGYLTINWHCTNPGGGNLIDASNSGITYDVNLIDNYFDTQING